MPTPILVCPVEVEIEKEVKLAESVVELGDRYKQSMRLGLNPERVTWVIKSKVLTTEEYQTIESQLNTFQGVTTFLWSPDDGATIQRDGYYCENWDWVRLGPDEWQLSAQFIRDFQTPCEAFADFIDDTVTIVNQIEAAIGWLNTYTRDTLPLAANAQYVSANAFHSIVGKGGYIPPNCGTSLTQASLIRSLLRARKQTIGTTAKATALTLATNLANAMVTYHYGAAVPSNPTAQLWLPHWLINAKGSFTAKGAIATKQVNNGHYVTVSFTAGVGQIPTGSPNWGDKLSEVYRVYSTDGALIWQNVNAVLESGTDYAINYWVSDRFLSGTVQRVYPNSQGNAGNDPTATSETVGKIVLSDTGFTGNAIVVYSSYSGATIVKNSLCEAYPIWRALDANEKNSASEAIYYLRDAYALLYEATADAKWNRARQATEYSYVAVSSVINDSFIFLKDTATTDGYSYPGTKLVVTNNSSGATLARLGDGWIQATVADGVESNPSVEIINTAVSIQMETGLWLEYEIGSSVDNILEIYLSTNSDQNINTERYSFWKPVNAGVTASGTIVPGEFLKWDIDTIWHPTIAEPPYTAITSGDPGTNSITFTRELVAIDGYNRLIARADFLADMDGYAGFTLTTSSPGNLPPTLYYSESGYGSIRLKIVDGASQVFYWDLPDTAGDWNEFIPTWDNATVSGGIPSDADLTSITIEVPPGTYAVPQFRLWYVGVAGSTLPDPSICFKTGVVSRNTGAHTFKVGNVKGTDGILNVLDYNPGVQPFTANLTSNTLTGWQGTPYVGYQSPRLWSAAYTNYPSRVNQVLQFLSDSQDDYAEQNLSGLDGFFSPAYIWPVWSAGVGQTFDSWSWAATDPNSDWEGYQFRAIAEVAKYWLENPTDKTAKTIVMRFLAGLDSWQKLNNESRCPTKFPAGNDPTVTYNSPHASALAIRTALFANLSGGTPVTTFRIIKRNLDWLQGQYVSTGPMAGTWSKDQPNFTVSSTTYNEYFMFWHSEIIETLSYLKEKKAAIVYPACSTNLG